MENAYSLLARLKEPSSWSSLAVFLGVFGIHAAPEEWSAVVNVGTGLAALLGFLLPEARVIAAALTATVAEAKSVAAKVLPAIGLALILASCSQAQIQTAESQIVATVNAACTDYAPLSILLHAVPNPAVQGVLLFGDAMCTVDGTVQTAAIAKLDPSSAAWVGGLTQSLKQMAAAPHTVGG